MNLSRLFWGGLLIVGGVVFLGDALEVWDGGELASRWWPLVIIAAAGLSLLSRPRRYLGPTVVASIGVVLLIDRLDLVDVDAGVIWAVILIAAGAIMVLRRPGGSMAGDEVRVSAFTAFGGTEIASHSDHFEGGNIGAVFGGAELDLRDAHLAPGAALEVFTAFGGTEIKVPEGWKVITHGLPLFGGFENVTTSEALPPDAPTLDVAATVLFGGLEVKH